MKKNQKGFSLIELLIVVAIILIIAAIAIPNLLKSRIAANEASAVGSIRTIATSEISYSTSYPQTGFTSMANLGGTQLIDAGLAAGSKSGYNFVVTLTNDGTSGAANTAFVGGAGPQAPGSSGVRGFCTDASGILRYEAAGTATPVTTCPTTDNPL